jgi:curli production assembly/transport component CsgF
MVMSSMALSCLLALSNGHAQALKYTPTNPHFGGSPFNGADLMSSAAAQKDDYSLGKAQTTTSALTNFANNLDARISAGMAQYISNQLFSTSPGKDKTGTVTLGDLSISYTRNDSTVDVVMTSAATGQTQTATYPLNIFVP